MFGSRFFPWIRCGFASLFVVVSVAHVAAQSETKAMESYTEKLTGTAVSIAMTPIRAGTEGVPSTFLLGSAEDAKVRRPDEGPPARVKVEPFWMSTCEITWDAYNEFRREYSRATKRLDGPAADAGLWADAVSIPTPLWEQDSAPILKGLGTEGGFPAADISQFAARQFTKWLSRKTGHFYRLPTEAEWEFAARAGTATTWFFGDDAKSLGDYAWTFDNSAYDDPEMGYPGTGMGYRKVGLKKPNPFGLFDIYGNVAEWVIDAYAADHYASLAGKEVAAIDAVNWPKTIYPCVVRGGHWESEAEDARSASRTKSEPKWQYRDPQIPKSIWWFTDAFNVGFRIVRPLTAPPVDVQRRFHDGDVEAIKNIIEKGGKQARVTIGEHQPSEK